ncbi:MAG TPA: trypsin-like peptidase domain-containing protein [Longimicrobium sp.]|nr:trypsin-like peptidase domain-containing protein [Longimicrobium sp.]
MNTQLRKLVIPGVLAAGLGAGITLADVIKDPVPDAGAQLAASQANATPVVAPDPSAANLSSAFRAASRAALGAVVQVRVETAARTVSQQIPPEFRGTPFEDMLGGGRMRVPPQQGSGSGFILSADGFVVTNNHVVDDAARVKVVLSDKREYDARVVGRDPNTDIAVVKIDAAGLPTARLGDSDQLETGDWVLALGYPLQLGQTTTAGIVSAKGRSIGIMAQSGATNPLEHYIQTDAAINPGNSGGPLVDLQGRVVGVNSAIASPTGYYSGYGFAVPINVARRVADDLVKYGVVHRPKMGVLIRDVSTADAEVFKLPTPDGAVVSSEPQDGARAAGLRMGDVIVAIDGRPVASAGDVMEAVMRKAPGESVKVDYIRYGDRGSATLRLGEMAQQAAARPRASSDVADDEDGAAGRVGFRAQQMTPDIAAQIQATRADGVVVSAVDPQGPAAGYLAPGLVIERFNGRPVATEADLREAVAGVRAGQVISLTARRPDGTRMIINYRASS